jgi:quinol monooxygenase YgiN
MVNHILLYRFKPGVDRIDEHLQVISRFEGRTKGLVALRFGRNICERSSDKYTHGFVMTFEDKLCLQAYRKSPAHNDLVNRFKDDIEEKLAIDLEV